MHKEEELREQSLIFEQKHNTRYRYSKLKGRTPQMALEQSSEKERFPQSEHAPRCPLMKPDTGKYHLVRFIRSNAILDVFGERFPLPPEAAYEYAVATIDVEKQTMEVEIAGALIDQRRYLLR